MQSLMKKYTTALLFLICAACSPYSSNLEKLGTQSSFTDVEIPADFPGPEEEGEGEDIEITPPETPPPVVVNLKNTFYFENQSFALAHGPGLRWDGCVQEKQTQGGYNSDTDCGRGFFHPAFADNLNDAFYICVSEAAQAAQIPQPHRIFIRHLGSYVDRNARNSSRLSNHAYARAWDIVNFNLYDADGNRTRISTLLRDYVDQQAVFYDEFRSCWRDSLPSSCVPGNTEYQGSIGHQASELGGNSLHNDHLHLSYPLCAGNS